MIAGDVFRELMSRFASGVTVVCAREADGTPRGVTVASFCSLSLDPPLALFCVAENNESAPAFRGAGHATVTILRQDADGLASRFATRGIEKFAGVETASCPHGVPYLAGQLAWMCGDRWDVVSGGDHLLWMLRVEDGATALGAEPVIHYNRSYWSLAGERVKP